MSRRSRSREVALQLLYEVDLNPHRSEKVSSKFLSQRLHRDEELIRFARELVEGVQSHADELDELISKYTQNWTITRIAATDRNVLRLGAYELIHTDTPGPVVINEAVELSKRFGGKQSAGFVNGVLDQILHREDKDQAC